MPERQLTTVTYHYVHRMDAPDFRGLKGLDYQRFLGQLDVLSERFVFVGAADVVAQMRGACSLPENACCLTFDDGLKDHYRYVFPELRRRGIQGLFYVPVVVPEQRTVLRVHKMHLLLGKLGTAALSALIFDLGERLHRPQSSMKARLDYQHTSRFDDEATGLLKWYIRSHLPKDVAEAMVKRAFEQSFGDESAVARRLYASPDELQEMVDGGMHIGGHGTTHEPINELSDEAECAEIERSLAFVRTLQPELESHSFAYPYGRYSERTLAATARAGFAFGWGTGRGGDVTPEHAWELHRYDTNDFPQPKSAKDSAAESAPGEGTPADEKRCAS